jgi:hypothetical protein
MTPERSKRSEAIDVYGDRFPLDRSVRRVEEASYTLMFNEANKTHRMPAK